MLEFSADCCDHIIAHRKLTPDEISDYIIATDVLRSHGAELEIIIASDLRSSSMGSVLRTLPNSDTKCAYISKASCDGL